MAVNIAYVHGVGEIGGAEKDLLSYIDLLDRCNFQPHVVCPGKGVFIKELIKKQVPIATIYVPPWRKLKGLIKLPLTVLKLVMSMIIGGFLKLILLRESAEFLLSFI